MSQNTPTPSPTPSRTRTLRQMLLLALISLSSAGCPEQASTPPEAKAPCREVGQRCEFAPGKLGSCVVNDNCQGPNCFVCQSQH
jgi:hypothetical protein